MPFFLNAHHGKDYQVLVAVLALRYVPMSQLTLRLATDSLHLIENCGSGRTSFTRCLVGRSTKHSHEFLLPPVIRKGAVLTPKSFQLPLIRFRDACRSRNHGQPFSSEERL